MALDPRFLPDQFRRYMPPEERKKLNTLTTAEIQEKIDLKNEKQLQEHVANLLRQRNIWFTRSRMDKRTSNTVGTPDFLLAVKGRAVAFECKIPGNDLSEEQKNAFEDMFNNGWYCRVIRSVEEAKRELDFLDDTQ